MHPLLNKEAFKNNYKHRYYPVLDENKTPLVAHDNSQAHVVIIANGRPQTNRKREASEGKSFQKSFCVIRRTQCEDMQN